MARGTYQSLLIARTGVQRGVVLSGAGENLTDTPGAGNEQVGDYARDYSGVFPDAAFANINTAYLQNLSMADSEFTIVLADGRGIQDDDLGDANNLLDDDDLDPEEGDGAFIGDGVERWGRVATTSIEMRFVTPRYFDAVVYTASTENGEIDGLVDNLQVVLDNAEVEPSELLGEADVWHSLSPHLRFTLHWALMVIKCDNPVSEGLADYANENGLAGVPNNPIPMGGPHGLLAAYGGDLGHAIRLWSPHEGSQVVRIVQRGEVELPYVLPRINAGNSPGDVHDIDIVDMDLEEQTQHGFEVPAVDSLRGKNIVLRYRSRRDVTIHDDEMLVFCVQSGRARLARGDQTTNVGDLIIAGPQLIQGRGGPLLKLYHWYAHLTGRTM